MEKNISQEEYSRIITIDDNIDKNNNINKSNKINKIKIENLDNINLDNINLDNINLDDYEIPNDEKEYIRYVDILNIFNVYFKSLFKKKQNSTLFDEIDTEDLSSTNRAMEKLYEEINNYKEANKNKNNRYVELFDPLIYKQMYLVSSNKLPEDYPFYLIDINNKEQKVTHNLITALNYIANFNWKEIEWSINQINEF